MIEKERNECTRRIRDSSRNKGGVTRESKLSRVLSRASSDNV
jgi:hypothetical protein